MIKKNYRHCEAAKLRARWAWQSAVAIQLLVFRHCEAAKRLAVAIQLFIIILTLQACASSDLSRSAATQADKAYINTDNAISHADGSISDAYQNSNQTSKGVAAGAATGLAIGGFNSSVGVIPGVAIGTIFGGALGAYVDSHTTLADKLQNRGGQVIILGDQIRIILPSVLMFNEMTSTIKSHAYSTLDIAAQFINQYPNRMVNVAAYTSASGSPEKVNLALSQQQADAIVKYLWMRGINTRLLVASGQGGSKLVAQNTPDWNSENYRVEITLEKLP